MAAVPTAVSAHLSALLLDGQTCTTHSRTTVAVSLLLVKQIKRFCTEKELCVTWRAGGGKQSNIQLNEHMCCNREQFGRDLGWLCDAE